MEFHEGCAMDHFLLNGSEIYLSWGNFANYANANDAVLGAVYDIRAPSGERGTIPADQKGASKHIDEI